MMRSTTPWLCGTVVYCGVFEGDARDAQLSAPFTQYLPIMIWCGFLVVHLSVVLSVSLAADAARRMQRIYSKYPNRNCMTE